MPKTLSVKNVADHIYDQLCKRAERHHRSLQGELMAIIEAGLIEKEKITPVALLDEVRKANLSTPSESAEFVRQDRHAH